MRSRIQKTKSAKIRDGEYVPKNPEPEPVTRMSCPNHVPKYGKQLWKVLVPQLIEEKVFTKWDKTSFELLCIAYHNVRMAQEELEANGLFTFSGAGSVKSHPALAVFNQASVIYIKFAELFGLSPMARKRIDLNLNAGKKPKNNKFSNI